MSEDISIMKPIVCLNGDNAQTLIDQQREIAEAAATLEDRLRQAAPHGRNYQLYPGSEQHGQDRALFQTQLERVASIKNEAIATARFIQKQNR